MLMHVHVHVHVYVQCTCTTSTLLVFIDVIHVNSQGLVFQCSSVYGNAGRGVHVPLSNLFSFCVRPYPYLCCFMLHDVYMYITCTVYSTFISPTLRPPPTHTHTSLG